MKRKPKYEAGYSDLLKNKTKSIKDLDESDKLGIALLDVESPEEFMAEPDTI